LVTGIFAQFGSQLFASLAVGGVPYASILSSRKQKF